MGIKTSNSMTFSTTAIVLLSLLACSQFIIQGVLAQDPTTTATPTTSSTDCPFNPCFNGGLCVKKGDYFDHCECPYGFAGTVCDKQVPTTTSPPPTTTLPRCSSTFHVCFNGGECRIQGSGYVCLCPTGYTGLVCEDAVTSPAPTTVPTTTAAAAPSPTAAPTQGVTYPDPTGICSNNPCLNGGTCRPAAKGPGFVCMCPSGFGGSFCLNIVSGDSSTTPATTAAPTSQPSNQDLLKDCPNAARNQCFVGGRCHIEGSSFAPHLRCLCADDDGNHHTHSATTPC